MALSDRKIQILQAIINDYIETAEPVGSRTIAKKYNLGISSATIRNEMSDLEEMGLILQPHASSGRIPSDMGYRLYVDHLMQQKELKPEEKKYLQSVVARDINQIDYLMEESAKALSLLTNTRPLFRSLSGRERESNRFACSRLTAAPCCSSLQRVTTSLRTMSSRWTAHQRRKKSSIWAVA